jgi:hypothetical protein
VFRVYLCAAYWNVINTILSIFQQQFVSAVTGYSAYNNNVPPGKMCCVKLQRTRLENICTLDVQILLFFSRFLNGTNLKENYTGNDSINGNKLWRRKIWYFLYHVMEKKINILIKFSMSVVRPPSHERGRHPKPSWFKIVEETRNQCICSSPMDIFH